MQEAITKTVIDRLFAISQCRLMLTADDILDELIRQIDAKKVTQADVARHLGIPPPRVKEMHKRTRRVQQREMKSLANRSEEHTSELQSLMRSSYAVFC